jgi:hypothetical protein
VRARGGGAAVALSLCVTILGAEVARADATTDDTSALFADGLRALSESRPGDAIADFEAMGDRGVVDAAVSFDRGLAYAERARSGKPTMGDFGRAAHGFEEARSITHDPALAREATQALATIRAEVARRRALAGEPVDVDPGVPLGRAVVALVPEDTWAALAAFASMILTVSLFIRWRTTVRRARLGTAISAFVSGPVLVLTALLALAARDERLHLREGVLTTPAARLSDDHHLTTPGAAALPEGARVTIEESQAGWTRVRFGNQSGWLPSPSVRPLTRPD